MESVKGTIEKIIFRNEENGYIVAKISSNSNDENLTTIVGNIAAANAGENYEFKGEWVNNPKYGQQFKFKDYILILPTSLLGLKRYLSSGLIKGVGPSTAERIVNHFGNKTLEILESNLQKLTEIEGIAEKRMEIIRKSWQEQKEIKRVMIFLQSYQITTGYAVKIYKTYGTAAIEKLKENPYRLVDDVMGIGFKIADRIAQKMGIKADSPARIKAGIKYILQELANKGHCYGEESEIIKFGSELLEADESLVEESLKSLKDNEEVILQNKKIWLPYYYFAELGVSKKLIELLKYPHQIINIDIKNKIEALEKEYHISFAREQEEAINKVLMNRVLVLTGGPGTGKTTTTLGLIELFKELKLKISLAAPTGRAAKKISETTGREAKTIHRLLKYSPKNNTFLKNAENPIKTDVIIIDEVSMIDIILMNNLLKAILPGTFLILIGDVDQLPSVGPGNILKDIIGSEVIPVARLTRIFRQERRSLIIVNAHRINEGKYPVVKGERERDFYFIEEENSQTAAQKIINLCTSRLPSKYKIDPVADIQVLTPMYKGEVGADNLNYRLREALNPKGKQIKYRNHSFRENDKVMQIKNNYDKEVFNGDIGRISKINIEDNVLEVNFYYKKVTYDFSELNELVLAYAITVHKSQGSEYRIVIIPVTTQHYLLLQRNLLYTGITRAKEMIILIGTKKALWIAIKNDKTFHRNTLLRERLMEIGKQNKN
ncbi:MAG: ATP-dependent RecD-like DNA helicase [Candidatus Caldatribacteriota bacterium]|nr:ATP-dependent RecD-like DNA helicase [Candidatus Caldatribacteriota bacterium]